MNANTLILGNGSGARELASLLAETGTRVTLAGTADAGGAAGNGNVECLRIRGCLSCAGTEGGFRVALSTGGGTVVRNAAHIILADDPVFEPNLPLYRLEALEGAVSLADLGEWAERPRKTGTAVERIALLNGLAGESHPVVCGEMMHWALRLQREEGRQTYFFTGNLKVAEHGLEALYRETKTAGTIYVKATRFPPEISRTADGRVVIEYLDEVTRRKFRLSPDLTVVDETVRPSPFTREALRLLGIDGGPDGFAQSDNVHRIVVRTNRRGIYVAGFSRGIVAERSRRGEAANVALELLRRSVTRREMPAGKAEIDEGQCIRCLTCLRSCPYRAITLGSEVRVDPFSCEACGICAAECPAHAIRLADSDGTVLADRIPAGGPPAADGAFVPSITAFCCTRSAMGAAGLAAAMGCGLPKGLNLVEVPCAGSISPEHLLTAFLRGADGVLVLTCHMDNCHSEQGNVLARQRVEEIRRRMTPVGLAPGRLALATLASNMGTELSEIAGAFEKELAGLGPSRLRG